jgi:diaminopimelate decarboxylase
MKSFELERLQLLFEESQANLTEANLGVQKQSNKVELLTREYYELKTASDLKIGGLEAHLTEQDANLSSYESLEKELDDVVMHAAESDDPNHALLAYGYGSNVPSMAKRRLKQSILLARRLLAAQKEVHKLSATVEKGELRATQLGHELQTANSMLEKTSQPYHYMIDGMKARDQIADDLKEHVSVR